MGELSTVDVFSLTPAELTLLRQQVEDWQRLVEWIRSGFEGPEPLGARLWMD